MIIDCAFLFEKYSALHGKSQDIKIYYSCNKNRMIRIFHCWLFLLEKCMTKHARAITICRTWISFFSIFAIFDIRYLYPNISKCSKHGDDQQKIPGV